MSANLSSGLALHYISVALTRGWEYSGLFAGIGCGPFYRISSEMRDTFVQPLARPLRARESVRKSTTRVGMTIKQDS